MAQPGARPFAKRRGVRGAQAAVACGALCNAARGKSQWRHPRSPQSTAQAGAGGCWMLRRSLSRSPFAGRPASLGASAALTGVESEARQRRWGRNAQSHNSQQPSSAESPSAESAAAGTESAATAAYEAAAAKAATPAIGSDQRSCSLQSGAERSGGLVGGRYRLATCPLLRHPCAPVPGRAVVFALAAAAAAGWLPSFWLKLRSLSAPAPDTQLAALLGSITGWPTTLGAVAVLTAVAVIIAADTGAYFVGKALGRTKLTDISPKKTVEGAAGGMAAAVAVALGSWAVFAWPSTPLGAVALGVSVFFSSLFGDLIESIMKRDAGMKDSGDLIPGHGGLLDRFDSYIFSGAVVYFFTVFCLPLIDSAGAAAAVAAAAAARAVAPLA